MRFCIRCKAEDGVAAYQVVNEAIENPTTKVSYSGLVCARCYSLGRITRVTCRTFAAALPAQTAREGRSGG
jgi:ribosomal protein L40E